MTALRQSQKSGIVPAHSTFSESNEHALLQFCRIPASIAADWPDRMNELTSKLCRFLLDTYITQILPSQETRSVISHLLDRLTSMFQQHTKRATVCMPPMAHLSIQETSNTPHSGVSSLDWRQKLLRDLQTEASHQHSFLVSRFDMVYRDLEKRAEINEAPLRQMESDFSQTEERLLRLETQLAEANPELQQRDLENQNAYEERQRSENGISELIREVEHGNDRVRTLEQEQAEQKQKMAETIEQERTNMQASMTETMEHFEEIGRRAQIELKRMEDMNTNFEVYIERITKQLMLTEQERTRHLAASQQAEIKLTEQQSLINNLERRCAAYELNIKQLEIEKDRQALDHTAQLQVLSDSGKEAQVLLLEKTNAIMLLKDEVQFIEQRLEHSTYRAADLQAKLDESQRSADERFDRQESEHAVALRTLEKEKAHQRSEHEDFVSKSEKETRILRDPLSKIKSSYSKRCQEFQKAQDLSRRLMAVMGGDLATQTATHSPVRASSESAVLRPSVAAAAATKRTKAVPSSASKQFEKVFSQGDVTGDLTYDETDKENQGYSVVPQRAHREDSAILSELSGLGI